MHRRGAGVFAVVLGALAFGPVPIRRSQPGTLVHLAGAVVGGNEAEARRRHQAFLRSGHGDVDAPCVHFERHAAKRGHASTMNSAGWPTALMALPIASMSL